MDTVLIKDFHPSIYLSEYVRKYQVFHLSFKKISPYPLNFIHPVLNTALPLLPSPGNTDIRTIIHSGQTSKQFSNVEVALGTKQMGPAPHIQKDLDELMYVVEGTATVMIGNEIYEVPAGGWNFRPRGIVHSFWNASDKPLRFIDYFFNQNLEDCLEELFHQIIPYMIKNNLTPTDPSIAKRIDALDKKFGITWFHEQRQGIMDKYGLKA